MVLVYYYIDGKGNHSVFKTKYGYLVNLWIYFNLSEDKDKRNKMREVFRKREMKRWRAEWVDGVPKAGGSPVKSQQFASVATTRLPF